MSTCQASLLRTSYKKEEIKEIKPKGTPRILMPSKGQQNSTKGTNPRNIRSHWGNYIWCQESKPFPLWNIPLRGRRSGSCLLRLLMSLTLI
jgi:hypothetical protein